MKRCGPRTAPWGTPVVTAETFLLESFWKKSISLNLSLNFTCIPYIVLLHYIQK